MIRTIKSLLFLAVLTAVATSCQKELSAPDGFTPPVNNNNNTDSTDCKACTYYPFCDSSTYTYVDTTLSGAAVVVQTLDHLGDTTVDGKVFDKVSTSNSSGDQVSYHNCTAGVTTVFALVTPTNPVTQRILQANEAVGFTWTDVNTNAGQSFEYVWTIISKDLNRTVLSVPYSNVIQVHLTVTATLPGTTISFVFAESDYYFAPNVGLIENWAYDLTSGVPVLALHRVLQSYYIP